jgi:hypothetical protein
MGTILRERVAWTKLRPSNETRRSSDLTPEEQANVRAALRFLVKRHGTTQKLADAMAREPGHDHGSDSDAGHCQRGDRHQSGAGRGR